MRVFLDFKKGIVLILENEDNFVFDCFRKFIEKICNTCEIAIIKEISDEFAVIAIGKWKYLINFKIMSDFNFKKVSVLQRINIRDL